MLRLLPNLKRITGCAWLCALAFLAPLGSAWADAPTALPSWTVLALKPLAGNRVQPVTGIVLSADGLVLVPDEFAGPDDALIVLDGGTDIMQHGHAARLVQRLPGLGVAVWSVSRLQRPPARWSVLPVVDGAEVHLAAFPPAEAIAAGAAPVLASASLQTAPGSGAGGTQLSLAAGSSLPNVTGALLDRCGQLLGFAMANGLPSLQHDVPPRPVWAAALKAGLAELNIGLPDGQCGADAQPADAADGAAGQDAAPPDARPDTSGEGQLASAAASPAVPAAVGAGGMVSPGWLGLLGWLLAVLLAIGWAAVSLRARWRQRPPRPQHEALLVCDPLDPRPMAATPAPADTELADNSVLELRGELEDGTEFSAQCAVNDAAINVVIGRDEADLVINSRGVNRQHAVLSGSSEALMLTALGSGTLAGTAASTSGPAKTQAGTWINRVPVLKGEIMFVQPDDVIWLGEVSFRVLIRPAGDAGGSAGSGEPPAGSGDE